MGGGKQSVLMYILFELAQYAAYFGLSSCISTSRLILAWSCALMFYLEYGPVPDPSLLEAELK